jgi:hypothetical protein
MRIEVPARPCTGKSKCAQRQATLACLLQKRLIVCAGPLSDVNRYISMDITITGGTVSRRRVQRLRKCRVRYRSILKCRTFRCRRWQVDAQNHERKVSGDCAAGGEPRNLAQAFPARSDISTRSRERCNPRTLVRRGCHPCLGYVPLLASPVPMSPVPISRVPMSPGRTREIWSGRRDSNPRPRPWQGSGRAISGNLRKWPKNYNPLEDLRKISLRRLTAIPGNIILVLTCCLPGRAKHEADEASGRRNKVGWH